jgi:AbrB family looped-hinge helix DNA binding protein
MPTATLTSKGQITIPKAVRDRLELRTGDEVEFSFDGDDRVTVRAARVDVGALRGSLRKPGRAAVSLEDMDAAVARGARRGSAR